MIFFNKNTNVEHYYAKIKTNYSKSTFFTIFKLIHLNILDISQTLYYICA